MTCASFAATRTLKTDTRRTFCIETERIKEMKDKNGINTECYNCAIEEICKESVHCGVCKIGLFLPSKEAYEDRIEDLQNELTVVQESERAEAQEADRLRGEVKELEQKLTETVKLLGEMSRECGKLQALLEVKNRSNMSTQSTDAVDVSKNGEKSTESEQSHLEDFTNEEIDFIKKAISMAIFDCETNPPKPSDENLKLMWSIRSKCDAVLKANVRENRTPKEGEEK